MFSFFFFFIICHFLLHQIHPHENANRLVFFFFFFHLILFKINRQMKHEKFGVCNHIWLEICIGGTSSYNAKPQEKISTADCVCQRMLPFKMKSCPCGLSKPSNEPIRKIKFRLNEPHELYNAYDESTTSRTPPKWWNRRMQHNRRWCRKTKPTTIKTTCFWWSKWG